MKKNIQEELRGTFAKISKIEFDMNQKETAHVTATGYMANAYAGNPHVKRKPKRKKP